MITMAEVRAQVKALPVLSTAVARMSAVMANERANAGDLEQAIRPDPALTANLLRAANSALYGRRVPIETVRHAIVMLGMREVYNLATAASLAEVIPPRVPGYNMLAVDFWTHSIAVGELSARVAALASSESTDIAFTAGLLHDVGKLAVGAFLSKCGDKVIDRVVTNHLEYFAAEREALGVDHAEAGSELARAWNLPKSVALVALWHHRPNERPDPATDPVVDVVHVADCLAHALGFGADGAELARKMEGETMVRLNVRSKQLELVASGALATIKQLAAFLDTAKQEPRIEEAPPVSRRSAWQTAPKKTNVDKGGGKKR